jgi:methylornithine synthase
MRSNVNDANKGHNFEALLSKIKAEENLSDAEITFLLNLQDEGQIEALFQQARNVRQNYFGNKIFMYGFIYASTYCRNDCNFCLYRRSNSQTTRYRKSKKEVVAAATRLADSGIHLIDLTMGEDPAFYTDNGAGFDRLVDLIVSLQKKTGLPIMVSPGMVPAAVLRQLVTAGAVWYACYQETHSESLFKQLRPDQDYHSRMQSKVDAHHLGLLVEEGLLCGVGETSDHITHSLRVMKNLAPDQMRVMNFVPQPGTPMAKQTPPNPLREMLIIAIMRLIFPDRLIPASLDVAGIAGLRSRLNAGANVVTSIVPPGEGLVGVAQHSLNIEEGGRTTAAVKSLLQSVGLQPATRKEYQNWIKRRQHVIAKHQIRAEVAC